MAVHHDTLADGEGAVAPQGVVDLLHREVTLGLRVAVEGVVTIQTLLVGVMEEDGAAGVLVVGFLTGFRTVGIACAARCTALLAFPNRGTAAVVAVGGVLAGFQTRAAVGVRDVSARAAERALVADVGVVHDAPEVLFTLDQIPVRVVDVEAVGIPRTTVEAPCAFRPVVGEVVVAVVVIVVLAEAESDGLQVVDAGDGLCLVLRLFERGQEHGREDRDDGDHDEQFN